MISNNIYYLIKNEFPYYKNDTFHYWVNASHFNQINEKENKKILKRIAEIKKIKKIENKYKILTEYINSFFPQLKENSKFNIKIQNLPKKQKKTEVNIESLYNTFIVAGKIFNMHYDENESCAYFWFFHDEDAKELHDKINCMQIGNNIIYSTYKASNCIKEYFEWSSGKKKRFYENKGYKIPI